MKATGAEEKGKGQASATVTSTMQQAGGGTRVMLSQDIQMTGAIAQYGQPWQSGYKSLAEYQGQYSVNP